MLELVKVRKNKKTSPKKVVVLLSGGLDSGTLAYYVANMGAYTKNKVFTLTFDYGQRHKKELTSASTISRKINAQKHKIVKFDLTLWGGSALTDKNLKIPKNNNYILSSKKLAPHLIPVTYVPARNTIFLSFALSYAEAIHADEIYIGVNSVDYSGYVDCRLTFIKKFQELAKVGTVTGSKGKTIKIKTPLIHMTKAQIVRLGQKLGVDWKATWSCYTGDKLACGLCDSCQLRLKGFVEAGIKDPIKYKTFPTFYNSFLERDLINKQEG